MLSRPYPTSSFSWKTNLPIGLFIAVFLLIFQPFGLSQVTGAGSSLSLAGYGLLTFLVLQMDQFLLGLLLRKESTERTWTVGKELLTIGFILWTIGLANYFYSIALFPLSASIRLLLTFQFFTLAVGIIPVTILTLLRQIRLAKENLRMATSVNTIVGHTPGEDAPRTITIQGESEVLELDLSDFLFAESTGNYLNIHFLKAGFTKSSLIRCTLKSAETQLEHIPSIVRCHRAYLLNADCIQKAKGNAQGLRLQLQHSQDEIPVSRSYAKKLLEKIQSSEIKSSRKITIQP